MPRRPEPAGFPFRVTAGVLLTMLMGVGGALETAQFVRQYNRGFRDAYQITRQEIRFEKLRAALPPSGVIGYVSDKPQNDTQGAAMFFGAQYALAPRVLVRESAAQRHDLVIGNFSGTSDFHEVARLLGLQLVLDAGQGVVLFRRTAP